MLDLLVELSHLVMWGILYAIHILNKPQWFLPLFDVCYLIISFLMVGEVERRTK